MAAGDPPFVAPGPGAWFSLATHWARPVTKFLAEIYSDAFSAGHARAAERLGLLTDAHAFGFSNRVPYFSLRVVPALVEHAPHTKTDFDRLLARDPVLAARAETAERTLRDRTWREELRRWDDVDKPQLLARHRELLAVDPSSLSLDELREHIADCRAHLRWCIELHHAYTMPSLLPVGDLMAHVEDWTGGPGDVVLRMLRGSRAVTLDDLDLVTRAAQAIRSDAVSRSVLAGDDPVTVLHDLVRVPGPARGAVVAYVNVVGHRTGHGHDVNEPCAIELPELLVGTLREAVAGTSGARPADSSDLLADLRQQIPPRHREEFDAMLAEARVI